MWRRYENLSIKQVRREHLLLARLADADLPFAVPTPLSTRDGDPLVVDGAMRSGGTSSSQVTGPSRVLSTLHWWQPPSAC